MKFQKSIELWGKEAEIRSGKLKLQVGQHVTCGGSKGRYLGLAGQTIGVVYDSVQFVELRQKKSRLSNLRRS